MKIKYSIIFLGIILVSLFSCSNTSTKQKTDLEKENLKGDVICVSVVYGNDKQSKILLYNSDGNLEKDVAMQQMGFITLNTYYYNGKLKQKSESKSQGINFTDISYSNYKYDKTDKLILVEGNNYVETYLYDDKSNLSETICKWLKQDVYKSINSNYSYSGNLLDSVITTDVYSNDQTIKFINLYNKDGEIIQTNSFENGELKSVSVMTYNENKDVVKTVINEFNPNKTAIEEHSYVYDSHKNWIESEYIIDGQTNYSFKRKIYYKGDDISPLIKKSDEIISSINNKTNDENNTESSNNNLQTESNDNSSSNTYQEPKHEKQQITCPNCQGKGFETCRQCSGNGMMKCSRCNNKGTLWTNGREESCYECNGTMRKNCDRCHGKGNTGSCSSCHGQGYYFK